MTATKPAPLVDHDRAIALVKAIDGSDDPDLVTDGSPADLIDLVVEMVAVAHRLGAVAVYALAAEPVRTDPPATVSALLDELAALDRINSKEGS